jgi:hypothetical protein
LEDEEATTTKTQNLFTNGKGDDDDDDDSFWEPPQISWPSLKNKNINGAQKNSPALVELDYKNIISKIYILKKISQL